MTVGCAVDPDTVPRMVRWRYKEIDRVPDVVLCCATLLISERVRDVMERFSAAFISFYPSISISMKFQLTEVIGWSSDNFLTG